MLQRIQTIWLLLAAITAGLGFQFPFATGTLPDNTTFAEVTARSNTFLLIATAVAVILLLFIVMIYTNRRMQLRLCILAIVLQLGLIFLYYKQTQNLTNTHFSLSSLLQVLPVLFVLLAAQAINKDEKMVRESDRLR